MGDLKKQVDSLKQAVAAQKNLLVEEQQKLNILADDLHAHAIADNAQSSSLRAELADRVQQACEKFEETHPDLAIVLTSTMQILQNMGI